MSNKAILVVSFGSSHKDTREKTIDIIENEIQEIFKDFKIYKAYTSKIILKILKQRDNIQINTVVEALEEMHKDGIEEVIIQPTLILNGIEYEIMREEINEFRDKFKSIKFGTPLLTTTEDSFKVVDAFLSDEPNLLENEAIVFMGHGSDHFANSIYASLDYMFKSKGYNNIFVSTVEAYPNLEDILSSLKKCKFKKIILIPFMIVAGEHAKNDMASDEDNSWKTILENEGFEVECVLKGLGENSKIRKIFIEHIKDVIKEIVWEYLFLVVVKMESQVMHKI